MPRKRGGTNKGYWFRKGRPSGWFTTHLGQPVKLVDAEGRHLRDPKTPQADLIAALALFHAVLKQEEHERLTASVNGSITVGELCHKYLESIKGTGGWEIRARALHNLTTGVPWSLRELVGRDDAEAKAELAAERIHPGYAHVPIAEFTVLYSSGFLGIVESESSFG